MNKKLLSYIFLLLMVPIFLLFLMVKYDLSYFPIISLIIVSILLGFIIDFELSRPKSREIGILSVLVVMAIGLRAIFIWFPQFKPGLGVVIISGIVFGPLRGFMVGSLSMLLSNIIFGQGPWTPWQMFAFGLVGFISYFFRKLLKSRIYLSIYGFLSVILVLGPILDTQTALFTLSEFTPVGFSSIYLMGFIMNVIHGLSVSIFLYLLGEDFIKKLERLRDKYGGIDGKD